MSSTVYTYTLTGQSIFPVNFEYLARRFVIITLVGATRQELTLNVDYRFTSKMEITTTVPQNPGEFTQLEVRRRTSATDRLVNFTDGSILRSQDLNISQIQAIHIAEEGRDISESSLVHNSIFWDALGYPIKNVGYGSEPTDAVNVQGLNDQMSRALRGGPTERLNEIPTPALRQGRLLGFDASGQPVAVTASSGSSTELEMRLRSEQPTEGTSIVTYLPPFVGGKAINLTTKLAQCKSITDFMVREQRDSITLGTLDLRAFIQNVFDTVPSYSTILFPTGLYLCAGALGIVIRKPLTIRFEPGAWLLFNDNNAQYLSTESADVEIEGINLDGQKVPLWTRTGHAGIRVKDDGKGGSTTDISIIRPYIRNVAAAGILIGWSGEIGRVTVEMALVENTGADGVSVTYNTRDVTLVMPRCYNTGDDGISIVSYATSAKPVRRVTVTDGMSIDSHERGITVVGGEDIKLSGQSINAAKQGLLVFQDDGKYVTKIPQRVSLDVSVYNCGGNGAEIGRRAKDVSGRISVVEAKGARGILVGSGVGIEPENVTLEVSASLCTGIGVDVSNSKRVTFTGVNVSTNGLTGLSVAAGAVGFSYGTCNAYNNNTRNVAGTDNILLQGVKGFSLGSTVSIDDRATPLIERTMDIASCTDGIIGPFFGKKGTALAGPNIQATCSNVVPVGGNGPGAYNCMGWAAAAPTVTHMPRGTFLLGPDDKLWIYTSTGWKSTALT